MSARTLEELQKAVTEANLVNDDATLEQCALELETLATPLAMARAEHARGLADHLRENWTAAVEHYGRAWALYAELDELRGMLVATQNIAKIHYKADNYPAALEQYNRALAYGYEVHDRDGIADTLNSIGNVYNLSGDYPAALEHYNKSLEMYVELGQRNSQAHVTGNIGTVYYYISDYPTALKHFNSSLALHSEFGDLYGMASATGNVGNVYNSTDDYHAALEYYNKALTLNQQLGDRSGIAHSVGNIGHVYSKMGNYATALEHFRRSQGIRRELGEARGVVTMTARVLEALLFIGAYDEARRTLADLDELHLDEPYGVVIREISRAKLQIVDDNTEAAQATLLKARDFAMSRGIRAEVADVYRQLRDLAQRRNDLASYIEYNNEFTRINEEIQGKETSIKLAMQEKEREIAEREKETAKHLAVLHSTLPKHIADRVARGEVVNDHYEDAAVIFVDIVGFTDLSSQLDSRIVIEILDDVFTQCDAICAKHDVTKIKTIGDSYMAVAFQIANSEQRIANPADRAAQAAIEMMNITLNQALTKALEEALEKALQKALIEFRIGIHCGPVTAGVIGKERMQYDVWGDTVNVASRMESTSEPGRIHVSSSFALAVNGEMAKGRNGKAVTLHERGEIEVKGKGTMQTYWLE